MNLAALLDITDTVQYKIHAARWNGIHNPLDVFLNNKDAWHDWNCYFGKKHEFNRPYVLALADFYPENHTWLFGGIYHVKNYNKRPPASAMESHAYESELTDKGAELIGRLKIKVNFSRGRTFKLEGQIDKLILSEILPTSYTGPTFPGYDNASLSFSDLTSIAVNDRQDWKTALQNMKGIYLITLESGENYVGSAYGDVGIWARWMAYVKTKDGGNKEMRKLNIATNGDYITNARFTLIESWPMRTDDKFIIARENYWKIATSSRNNGLNHN